MGTDIQSLLERIIPPEDYQHRNGFNNKPIIDGLSAAEKELIEALLIEKLSNKRDFLIIETLCYMGSEKVLPILYKYLSVTLLPMEKIMIAAAIFEINKDKVLPDLCFHEFQQMKDPNDLLNAFYYLVRFKDPSINKLIEQYSDDSNYLVSYNAKRAISISKADLK